MAWEVGSEGAGEEGKREGRGGSREGEGRRRRREGWEEERGGARPKLGWSLKASPASYRLGVEGNVGGRRWRGGEGKEGKGEEFFKQSPQKQPGICKMGEGTEEGNGKISGALEAEEAVVVFASRRHQREQFLDQPGLQLLGEVGTLGAKGAGGGTSGWPLPARVFSGLQCLHCTIHKVRGAFQPFTCDDKSQSCACRGGARLHLPLPLGGLGLWLRGLLKTAPS